MANSIILKAGYLHRETSYLHRWTKNWFCVSSDGILKFFESDEGGEPVETINLSTECKNVIAFPEDVSPPDGNSQDHAFSLTFTTRGTWNLCAESSDDKQAWIYVIDGMRTQTINPPPPPPAMPIPVVATTGAYSVTPAVIAPATQTVLVNGRTCAPLGCGHHGCGLHGCCRRGYGFHHGCINSYSGYCGYCTYCSFWGPPLTSVFGRVQYPGHVICTNPTPAVYLAPAAPLYYPPQ